MNANETTARKVAKVLGLKYTPSVFVHEGNARSFAATTVKPMCVVLGDSAFWVVCLADAVRLENAGYEMI